MMVRTNSNRVSGALLIAVLFAPAVPVQAQQQDASIADMINGALGGVEDDADANENDASATDSDQVTDREPTPVDEASVSVEAGGAITLNAVDLPLSTALHVLAMETNRNIVASSGVTGSVTASLYKVSFEDALDAILIPNNAAYRVKGNFIYVYSVEELEAVLAAENPPQSRVFRLSYVPAPEIEAAIVPLLSPVGSVSVSAATEVGLDTSAEEGGGDSLADHNFVVVRDRPENIEAIASLIRELDVRPRQVLVEATILSAELRDDNNLGVDFTLLGGVDLELLNSRSLAVQNITVGQLPPDRFGEFNASATTDFTGDLPDGGFRLGVIKDHVALFVQALEEVTDTVVIANPKVLALNKQRGLVIVGRRDGYITTTVTETQAIQTVEFLETGTQLIFRPFIGEDGYVRMELHPEDSTGGLNAANLPFEQTTEVTTNVVVRDGQTILIGGLFRELNSDTRSQIPLLGDIPVLGTIFQSKQDAVQRQEVIILLTVHIIDDLAEYAELSAQENEDIERLRVGHRQGHMWHGREKLAQSYYADALEAYRGGDVDKALFMVRMALHNNQKFLPAIKLQEKIRQERIWGDDGTATRTFIQKTIMREQGINEPVFGRPTPLFDDAPPQTEAPASTHMSPVSSNTTPLPNSSDVKQTRSPAAQLTSSSEEILMMEPIDDQG